jgi:hypothetical protein
MKPKQKPNPGNMVEIVWIDTFTPRTMDWMDDSVYHAWAKDGMTIRSVGIVKMIDEKYYYLVSNTDVKKTADRTVCGAINVPRDAIKELHILKRSK